MGALGFDTLKGNRHYIGPGLFEPGKPAWNRGRKMTEEERSRHQGAVDKVMEERHLTNPKPWHSKEWLEDQYVRQGKSFPMIGRETGSDSKTIRYWAKKLGIQTRNRSDALKMDFYKGRRTVGRENHPNWKGGRGDVGGKYNSVLVGKGKHRLEHIVMAEKALGRQLRKGECVHHVNMNGKDNRPENLIICDNSYHHWLHNHMSALYVKEHLGGI